MRDYIIHNGKFYRSVENTVNIQSRGLRYGEGFFETMRSEKGKIELKEYHFERILKSFELLHFTQSRQMNIEAIEIKINQLLIKNDHLQTARIRLMFFGKNGGIYDNVNDLPDYTIESWAIQPEPKLNSNGLVIGIYEKAIKVCDAFSNLKSNNFLPYVMAADHAKKNKLNDCIILNMHGRICDTTIANLFIIKNKKIITPSLDEGCIAGVMRRNVIERIKEKYSVEERAVTVKEIYEADEIFLTNAIKGIRWVKSLDDHTYSNKLVKGIYDLVNSTI